MSVARMARLFCRDLIASEASGGFVRTLLLAIGLVPLSMLIACGGSGNNAAPPPPPPAQVRITVSPGTANISVLDTQQFTATVSGSTNTSVTWSVVEQNGGTVDSTGKYTPPLRAGAYHVLATAQADTTKTAQAAVSVTAPAPVFTSTPPSAALEQTLYSYGIAATDPAGTAVTLALTAGPTGAAVSGGTLAWTPTPAQSRVANDFTVTATSDAGGSATQVWSVTPAGTIHGSIIDLYWNASGSTASPYDLTQQPIAALVPQPDGSVQVLPGVGNPDGTFTIANVPGGYYWLQAGWLYWTDSSTFDGGVDYSGRPWSPALDTTASFNLSGFDPWQTGGQFVIQAPNCGDFCNFWTGGLVNQPPIGATTFAAAEPVTMFAADAAKGDVTYVIQTERILGLGSQYYGMVTGPALVLNSLTVNSGATTSFAGTLAATNPQTIPLTIKGSQWATKFQNVGPSAAVGDYFWAVVIRNPFLTDRNLVGPYYFFSLVGPGTNPQLEWEGNGSLVDTNLGSATFTDPFPSAWPLVSMADYESYVSIRMPDGQTVDFTLLNWYGTPSLPTGGFAPLMSPVQNPLVNGASLFTPATSNTTEVTLSWTAPSGLPAYGYCVTPLQYDPATASLNWAGASLWTASTSMTVPAGILSPGNTYVFVIAALADGGANINTAPYRSRFPVGGAEVVSAAITISSNASVPAVLGDEKLLAARKTQSAIVASFQQHRRLARLRRGLRRDLP